MTSFPNEGFSAFVCIYGSEVIYFNATDQSTWTPKVHARNELYTPFGFILPVEQNHQKLIQAMRAEIAPAARHGAVTQPMLAPDGAVYQIELSVSAQKSMGDVFEVTPYYLGGAWTSGEKPIRVWATNWKIVTVISTALYLSRSMDVMLAHVAKHHGCRLDFAVRTTVPAIIADLRQHVKEFKSIEDLYYGCDATDFNHA